MQPIENNRTQRTGWIGGDDDCGVGGWCRGEHAGSPLQIYFSSFFGNSTLRCNSFNCWGVTSEGEDIMRS